MAGNQFDGSEDESIAGREAPETSGRPRVWTITTSPTVDVDVKAKLMDWDAPAEVGPGGGGLVVANALNRRGVQVQPLFFHAGPTGQLLIQMLKKQD